MRKCRKHSRITYLLAACLALLFVFHAIGLQLATVYAEQASGESRKQDVLSEYASGGMTERAILTDTSPHTAGADLTLKARVSAHYRDLEGNDFLFEVTDPAGNVVASASNDIFGEIQFPDIHYTGEDAGRTFTYTVRQKAGDDDTVLYATEIYTVTVGVSDDGSGKLILSVSVCDASGNPAEPVFTNALKDGKLEIQNEVDPLWNPEGEFSYEVEFFGPQSPDPVTFTLGNNETHVIDGIPGGTAYRIHHEAPAGWLTYCDGEHGRIKPLETAAARFYNDYEPEVTCAVLRATVLLDGMPAENARHFILSMNGTHMQVKSNAADGTVTFNPLVYAENDMFDPGGNPVDSKDFTYEIEQVWTQADDRNISYDRHRETVTVRLTRDDEGNLTAAPIYDEDGAVFRNAVRTGSLTVVNLAEGDGAPADAEFSFLLSLSKQGSFAYTKTNGETGAIGNGGTFTLKAGEGFTVFLPIGTTYRVTETDLPEGFTLSETINNGPRKIVDDARYVAYFTNVFRRTPATISLQAHKTMEYRTLKAGQFQFRLMDENHNLLEIVTNDADGKILFSRIEYTGPGTYTYFITEVEDYEDDVIVYDRGEQVVTVTVAPDPNDNTRLIATPNYDPNDESTLPTFRNSVNTDTAIALRKTVQGGTAATEGMQFQFTVTFTGPDGNAVEGEFEWVKMDLNGVSPLPHVVGQGTVSSGGTLTMGDGEVIGIRELPYGTTYAVVEDVPPGFIRTAVGAEGTLGPDNRMPVAEFVNTYSPYTVTYEVVNGTWADGTTEPQTEDVVDGQSPADIPTGMIPAEHYENGAWDPDPNGATITGNTTFTYTFAIKRVSVIGSVEWNDADNAHRRPEKVTVHLKANGADCGSKEVQAGATGLWTFSFDDLPVVDSQGVIDYTIAVDEIPEYTTEVETVSDHCFRIMNTLNYSITVNNGTADKTTAKAGETVTITADPPAEGKAFVQWAQVDGVDFAQADAVTTTFEMPAKDVELTPVYADILIPDIDDQTYTGAAITPHVGFLSGVKLDGVDRVLTQDTHYTIDYDRNVNAGTATLTVTMMSPSAGSKTASFQILPANLSVTTGSATKEYDGTPLTCQAGATITGLVNGETATVRATGSQTDVGASQNTYAIEWGTAKADNYCIAAEELGTLTVGPRSVTVTANDASKVYGQADPALTAAVTGLIGSDTVSYTVSREAGDDAGAYAIIPAGETAQGNYTVRFVEGIFTIEKAPLTLSLSMEGWTEGEAAHAPVLTGNLGDGAVTYAYKLKTSPEADYSPGVPTKAGEYTVRATVSESGNYQGGTATAEFTVSPGPVTVTGIRLNSDGAKKVYTEGDALDVTDLTLEVSKSDGNSETVSVTADMVSGFDGSKTGRQTLTVAYEGFTDTYEVEVKARPTYEVRDSSGNTVQSLTWQKGSGETLALTIHRSEDDSLTYGKFTGLAIGGKPVEARYYTTAEGSLKLAVKPAYLEALSVGDYDMKVNFDDGSAAVKLTVKAASNSDTGTENTSPKTGDESAPALWSSLALLSPAGLSAVTFTAKRRRKTR